MVVWPICSWATSFYERPALSDSEYVFKHALTQEVAFNSLLTEQRKLLHERSAAAVERLYSDRPKTISANLPVITSVATTTENQFRFRPRPCGLDKCMQEWHRLWLA